jgi:hypothetical protein
MSEAYAEPRYKCVEVDDGADRYWEIHLDYGDVIHHVNTIELDDMGDWIARMKLVREVEVSTWDSLVAWSQELWPR